MRLEECTFGRMVMETPSDGSKVGRVGFVKGLTYNVHVSMTGDMSAEEKLSRTIPLVEFPDGELPVHHSNLEPYE